MILSLTTFLIDKHRRQTAEEKEAASRLLISLHSESSGPKPGMYPSSHPGMDAASRHEQEAAHASAINTMKGLGLPYPGLGSLHHLSHPHQQPHHWSTASAAAAAASHAQLMANHLNGLMRPGSDAMSMYASSLQGHLSSQLL